MRENYKFTDEEYDDFLSGVEIWRDVPGWEGFYQASTYGKIRSVDRMIDGGRGYMVHIKERIMKETLMPFGYKMVGITNSIKKKHVLVHVMVANTFLHNPENKAEVNHIDGIRDSNYLTNLEMVTRSENILHSFAIGTRIPTCLGRFGKDHGGSKPIQQLNRFTKEIITTYEGLMDAHRITGIEFKNISAVARGLRNHAGGYAWKYVDKT